jgi:hypothetical protein
MSSAKYRATHKEQIKAYRATHEEQIKAYLAEHKEQIKERKAAYDAAYRATHEEQIKAYLAEHEEQIKERKAAYREAHAEHLRAERRRAHDRSKSRSEERKQFTPFTVSKEILEQIE